MLFGLQLLDEGLELLVPDLRIERVAHLGADHALLVDDEGLGNARDAEVTIRSGSLSPRTGTGRFTPCKSARNPAYGRHRNAPNRK